MSGRFAILVCEALRREVATVLKMEGLDGITMLVAPCDCSRPCRQNTPLASLLDSARAQFDQLLLIGGPCLMDWPKSNRAAGSGMLVQVQCGFELFLPAPLIQKYQREGAYLLTPGWLATWPRRLEAWGFDQQNARDFFSESCTRLVLLDTGIDPHSPERLEALAAFVDRPGEVIPVGLDLLRLHLVRHVAQWRSRAEAGPTAPDASSVSAKLADYAMVFDVMGSLAGLKSEQQVARAIFALFDRICAPGLQAWLPVRDGQFGELLVSSSLAAHAADNRRRMTELREDFALLESGAGFIVRLFRERELLGVLLLEDIGLPQHRDHYLNFTLTILPVLALAVSNARHFENLEHARAVLRESEDRFRTAFEKGAIAMLLAGLDKTLLQVNPVFCQMLGFSQEELVGRPFTDITHPDDLVENLAGMQRLYLGEVASFRMEKRYIRKDGQVIWGDMCTAAVRDAQGKTLYFVTHVQDITARKQAEEALRSANASLAEADKCKDEFLAMLAHELRNPLAPVRNAMQVLRLTCAQDPRVMRQQDIIDRQVSHMARLLDDLLDVSRVTRGKIELQMQPLDLASILAHAVETTAPLIEARRQTLVFSPPPGNLCVHGDLDRLAQVFGNLLTNAAKYTDEGGRVWLEAGREHGTVVVRVRDTGVGIAPEMLGRVFDLFAQADHSLGRSRGGLGIGLTMVRNLVALHGGSVEAHSEGLGQGCEFVVRLPALSEGERAPDRRKRVRVAASASAARRVLVVDDVVDSASSLAELIQLWGHETQSAFDGLSALNVAQTFRPDVVLLDIGMPGMDGCETARRLRAEHGAGLTLVALTGYGQTQDREATHTAGFNHHLVKPVDLQQLQAILT